MTRIVLHTIGISSSSMGGGGRCGEKHCRVTVLPHVVKMHQMWKGWGTLQIICIYTFPQGGAGNTTNQVHWAGGGEGGRVMRVQKTLQIKCIYTFPQGCAGNNTNQDFSLNISFSICLWGYEDHRIYENHKKNGKRVYKKNMGK